ncbi:shikimate dehydrogenase substrate binding protein, partial [Mycena sp. CBHHK59/15]
YRLYGYPVHHSASPAFHNAIFDLLRTGKHYSTFSTSQVIPEMLDELHSDGLGGYSVTMPIKGAIILYLDDITPESRATGAVNTIIK